MELHELTKTNSIANHFLSDLRDANTQKDRLKFRRNLERIGEIMAYEFSKTLDYEPITIQTPLAEARVEKFTNHLVLVTLLRAGIPFYDGFLNYFDQLDSGFVGAFRANEGNKDQISIDLNYVATKNLTGKEVLLIDPMLATGKSVVKAVNTLIRNGQPQKVHLFSVISTWDGLDYLKNNLTIPYSLWTGAVDQGLNENAFIQPGLGDAGDLSFGEKI